MSFAKSKKLTAATLTGLFILQQALIVPVMASEITSITGGSNIGQTEINNGQNTQFDIRPDFDGGNGFGFKQYGNFNLSQGDIANLIMEGGIDKFVNLVGPQIVINGVLNSILNGNIGGHVIFVSPNGMVVGASGVLNVGSLTAIAPTTQAYNTYIANSAISGVLPEGYTHENNLAVLKASDMGADIVIKGKIIARDNVELIGKQVNIGNTSDNKAGIIAGADNNAVTVDGQRVNQKLATTEAAGKLFDALVNNNVQNGAGFGKDANGNITITAQSVKTAVVSGIIDKITLEGQEWALDQLIDINGKVLPEEQWPAGLKELGVTPDNILTAYQTMLRDAVPSDATNVNAHEETNYANVNIQNAVLAANDIDASAVSRVDYVAQKGNSTLFNGMPGSNLVDMIMAEIYGSYEGARAKASVTIDSGAELKAKNDINLSSLAIANTSMKLSSFFNPKIDSNAEYYYAMGSKTVSEVNVNDGAVLSAVNDVVLHAQSQNSHNIKIKNPTSSIGSTVAGKTHVPNIQISFLRTDMESDTTAAINSGAKIEAKNVEVDAVNVSHDSTNVQSVATVSENSGTAIAITLKDANINTTAKIDSEIDTNGAGNVSVNAQNLHMSTTTSKADVEEGTFYKNNISFGGNTQGASNAITNLISSKIGSLVDVGSLTDLQGLPNLSTALVVNDSTINTTAQIGKNANIHADTVSVNANAIDLTVNTASSHVSHGTASGSYPSGGSGASEYIPNPGVAVIVNNQENNTTAEIEDGTSGNFANVTANDTLSVNATTEMPRNGATFEFIINLLQTGSDIANLPDDIQGNLNAQFGEDWDIRLLMQGITNPAGEVSYDISNVLFGFKNTGLTSNLGLQGFFNNWAETKSTVANGMGVAASVIDSSVTNNTTARIGDYSQVSGGDVIVNAANQVVQYNAAGDVAKLWGITEGVKAGNGIGGTVVVENVESNAKAQVGDNVVISNADDVEIAAANQQDFLTAVVTGSQATSASGVAVSGSVTVQDVSGTTEASLGKSRIEKAKNVKLNAGKANINLVETAEDQLFGDDVFEQLPQDDDRFEVGLDLDLNSPTISNFGGVDSDTGLLSLKESSAIKDGISNILIAGAIAQQSVESGSGSSGGSSSGVAAGASVNVSEFHRDVNAYIADGAYVKVDNALDVVADSYTQSLNIAIAGAFAGGVNTNEPGFIDSQKAKLKDKLSSLKGLFNKADNKLASTSTSGTASSSLDDNGNPKITVDGVEYVTNSDGEYYDPKTQNKYLDSNGNPVKYQGSTGSEAASLDNTTSHSKNMSAAAAGSVNAQINNSTVKAEIGNATIISGNEVNVEANQSTKALNVGGGVAKAATVGGGAAVNFIENTNETTAVVNGADITFSGGASNQLNVKAEENNDNVQVAIGVGATKAGSGDTTTQVSAGGSFNTDILENKVKAELNGVDVKHQTGADNIAVNVDAENHSTSYKGAGGLAVNVGKSGNTSVGAGMGGNLNLITKETSASITGGSNIQNAQSVDVTANKDASEKTEELISVGVGGTVVAGAQSGYTFSGAMATDVINNTITAEISNSTVSSAGDVNVIANNNVSNGNIAGALGFSTAATGVGVGVGAIVSVINNTVSASVNNNSTITADNVTVKAKNNEDLEFLAVNMGIQTGNGIPISANGIVNVIQNEIEASIADFSVTNSGNLSVISDYDNSIKGITAGTSLALGSGFAVGANVLSNTLLSSNTASITSSKTVSDGSLTVEASTDEIIDNIPAALAITLNGPVAAAANVGVNVVQNSTTAKIDGTSGNKSNITANSINVSAEDNTQSRSRGGTIAASGGTAAVGGTILADVYLKDVDAHIDNAVISDNGSLNVSASAKNIFGKENAGSITAAGLVDKIEGDYDIQKDTNYQDWDMAYNISGAATGSGAGSIISKNVINNVESYIGSGVEIQEAGDITVNASNKTEADIISGTVAAAGTGAAGTSIFSNVNVSNVTASINEGAKIGTVSDVGSVSVDADSDQIYKSIMAIIGAAGTAAVSGSVNSNIIVNSTNAYIANNTNINSNGTVNIIASDSMDVESLNIGIEGSGGASLGGVTYVNVLANKVKALAGEVGSTGVQAGSINADKGLNITAEDDQNFLANVALISGSGGAAIGLIGIANVMSSEVNAGIKDITVTTNNGSVSVNATNSFNGNHKDQTTGIQSLLDKSAIGTDDVTNLMPLVGVVSISGSGGASVGGTVIANVVTTEVNAYVENALISAKDRLNVNANSSMTTYDAAMSVVAAGGAAVNATGVTNVYSGSTVASVTNSVIENGSVSVTANDEFNLNTILFSAAASGGTSVNAMTNVNTISNTTTAKIENTKIKNASKVDVSAKNNVTTTDILAAGAISGGGAGNILPIVNVFTNNTNAFISGGSINNAATSVNAESDIDVISAILGVTGSGAGVSVSGYAGVNVFDNDLNAYIDSVNITNAQSTSVNSISNLDMDGIIGSVGINASGAGVFLNGIVNVIKNNINAYIANSDIQGGSIRVYAEQTSDIDNDTASVAANGIGAAISSNSLVSVFTNNLNSYISNTSTNVSAVSVETQSKQDIDNANIGVAASGGAAINANTIVNVLENTSHAYIDAKDKKMTVLGKTDVIAKDEILLNNKMGLVSAGTAGVGANVNVNVINNAVAADVLSSSNGKITSGSLNVDSESIIGLTEGGAALSAGVGAVATTVFINSIGGKVDFSDNSELNNAQINESVASANENFSAITGDINYSKDGQEQNLDNAFNLTSGEVKAGTTAKVAANVTTQGADGISVNASNTLKGYNSDEFTSTNAAISAGIYSAGVGVLVTDMNYNTEASIEGGNILADNNGKINVGASSSVKADIDAAQASAGMFSLGGNVGFFDNNSRTTSKISNVSSLKAGDISLNSSSNDDIDIDVVSASVSGVGANVSVSLAETNNQVKSSISGDVDIDAANMDIKSSNTSSISTSLDSLQVGGATFGVVVNRTESNAITNAIIDATGNIDVEGDLNIIASSDNVNAETTMSLGNIAALNLSVTEQGAFVNSKFKAGIDNSGLTINNGGKTTVLSGVKTSDNSKASVMNASVLSRKASVTIADVSVASLNAVVDADTEAVVNAEKFVTNDLDVSSMMQRTAQTGSESASIGAVSVETLQLNSSAKGSNTITINGDTQINNNANIKLIDDADVSTSMISGEISLIGAAVNSAVAQIDTDTTVNIGGNLAMNNMNVTSDVHRDSFNTAETKAGGLVRVGSYEMTTTTTGDSTVNITAKANNQDFNNGLTVISDAENSVDAVLSNSNIALAAIAKSETNNTLNASNTINIRNADINSKGLLSFDVDNKNNASMRRDSNTIGLVVIDSGRYKNDITSGAGISIDNAKLTAANLSLDSNAHLGTPDNKGIEYRISVSGAGAYDTTTVTNSVTQDSGIEIKNSELYASNQINANVNSGSDLAQSITSEGSGFVAKNVATSDLSVTNENKLSIDSGSKLYADNLNIAFDSSNNLSSVVDVKANHFGGLDPGAFANLTLNVNNTLDNSGIIEAGNKAQIDFMQNSSNILKQEVDLYVEAAVATADTGGELKYNTNNVLNVNKNAEISSGKDVIVNYSNGTNELASTIHSKKVSRLLFGIPITVEKTSSSISQETENSLKLDGEIKAGRSAQRYMLIDKDGNVDMSALQGFLENEYNVVDKANIDGEQLTQDAIQALNDEITLLKNKISQLESTAEGYETTINGYEAQITELNALLSVLNGASGTVTAETAEETFKNNFKNQVVGTNANQITEDVFNKIWDAAADNSDFSAFIAQLQIEQEVTDENGNTTTQMVNLSAEQQTLLNNTFNSESGKFVNHNDLFTTYNGQIIANSSEEITNIKNSINSSKDNLEAMKNSLESVADNLQASITSSENEISDLKDQISYLKENPISDLNIEKSAIEFANLTIPNSKIELNGITKDKVKGSGNFRTYGKSFTIDNYSNRDLVFSNINMDGTGESGLIIGGVKFTDTKNPVHDNVYLVHDTTDVLNDGNITINNYYDHSNPLLSVEDAIQSNIIFGGSIQYSDKGLNVWNESGNITFSSPILTAAKDIVAAQGNVEYNNSATDFSLAKGDRIIAGKDVTINAKNITIDGTVKAGYSDRNLTITEDMLSNLIVDPTTGEKNMVELGGSEKSDYLNTTNNIKVLYKDGKLLVFNTKQEGGNVNFTGNVKGSGSVTYTDGYAKVSIINNTDKELVINNLDNNRMNGTFTNQGALTNVTNQGLASAATTIVSSGLVNIAGIINNAVGAGQDESASSLSISSENGILVPEKFDENGTLIATINSTGNSTLSNAKQGSILVEGIMSNTGGTTLLSNAGTGALEVSGSVLNNGGNTTVTNSGDKGLTIAETGKLENIGGNTTIANSGKGSADIIGTVNNSGGDTKLTNDSEGSLNISGKVTNTTGNTLLTNKGNGALDISGTVTNTDGNMTAENSGALGLTISGALSNTNGITSITNTAGNLDILGSVTNISGSSTISNSGDGALEISGTVNNTGGNTTVTNSGDKGLTIAEKGKVENAGGTTTIANSGKGSADIIGTVTNTDGDAKLTNDSEGSLNISGKVTNTTGNTILTNKGNGALDISGTVTNTGGNMTAENTGDEGLLISGTVENTDGNTLVLNNSIGGMTVDGMVTNTAKNGKLELSNSGSGDLTIGEKGVVSNISETDTDNLFVNNSSKGIFALLGRLFNKKGNTIVNNTSADSGIKIATTGSITNNDGDINISNKGKEGILAEGIINSKEQNISITNENSDITIGEYNSNNDFYINAAKGNVTISQSNGSILNGISDPDTSNKNQNHDLGNIDKAYKTLINTGNNLTIKVDGGNIGSDTHALDGKESGFGINASTRDYTESINVNVAGVVNAQASNNGNALINIRAKDSDLKLDNVTSDGNIMLTAADWKQPDESPAPSDEEYYTGYSILNSSSNPNNAVVSGRNISLIASNTLGSSDRAFTYNQLEGGSVSVLAENDINLKGLGLNNNVWQLITKRGNLGVEFSGNAIIREINAGNNVNIVSRGENLTIYDLGKTSNLSAIDDILWPHDQIEISSVAPETVDISVLDINPTNDTTPNVGNSTLNIYNAYVRGQNNGNADVTLRADNIIAHAYDAASSTVSNTARPNGFDATDGRTYANDFTDANAEKNLKATGFNTVGDGDKLVFDIQGISRDDVTNAGGDVNSRTYNPQNPVESANIFKNPNGFEETVYKAKDVTLSLNSAKDNAPLNNRGMEIQKIYSDNAYVDTKDLNLSITDGFITNYAEFRNGNRGGTGIGDFIDMQNGYRWLAIVDNDYHRIISNKYNIPVTSQLYTALTGSFALNLGDTIDVVTKAPIVHYNPNTVVNLPDTENSFYRLTYKDNKIQYTTTTPDFSDIDKATYKPTKRTSIRFRTPDDGSYILVSEKKKDKEIRKRIIRVEDISREGISVVHDGSLQKGETFTVNLTYKDINVSPEVEVVRVSSNKAGLKFINMDKATANKILYLNMFVSDDMPMHVSQE